MKIKSKKPNLSTKSGAASMFIVVFTIMLLGIITLGFVRIISSETIQTTNTDLSQSAYDSALAGVEDARTALLYYHDCLSRGYTANQSGNACERAIFNMQNGIATQDCDTVANVLGRDASDGYVIVEEDQTNDANNAASMLQAYTCVKINEDLEDYRTTLNSNDRTRIIPIRSSYLNNSGNAALADNIKSIRFRWTPTDITASANIISLRLIQAHTTFTLSDFYANDGDTTDRAVMYFKPNYNTGTNLITKSQAASTNNKSQNAYFDVKCDSSWDFHCYVDIELPDPIGGTPRNEGATFLIATSPQGRPSMDFSVSLCTRSSNNDAETQRCISNSDGNLENDVTFTGVQARVDSTGRANDLYRRIETRLELVDINYPYPEFSIEQKGNTGGINKSFWVTRNCFHIVNGTRNECPNYEKNTSLAQ